MSASVLRQTPSPSDPGEDRGERSAATTSIGLHRRGDVLVIRPFGALDRHAMPRIRRLVLGAGRPVVLDLDECVLVDPRMLADADFDAGDAVAPEVRIVSRRLSCRRLLARAGASDRLSVHATVDAAVHAMRRSTRTGIAVSTAEEGRPMATVAVSGHVCPTTASELEQEIARLIEDGISELDVELGPVDTCLDESSRSAHVLASAGPGSPHASAADVVRRVLAAVHGADPALCRGLVVDDVVDPAVGDPQ